MLVRWRDTPATPCPSARDHIGVAMAKALLGYRPVRDDRLLQETARLRIRVRDLETLIADLQQDNDRLRAGLEGSAGAMGEPSG